MISRRIVIKYPPHLIDKPILCQISKTYDLEFNILRAQIEPSKGGLMVLEVSGEPGAYQEAIARLESQGASTQTLSRDIVWEETRCTHCGYCVTLCPSGALASNPADHRVSFDAERCVACEYCTHICPVEAVRVQF